MDHLGLGGELFQLAGHPVVETGPHHQQQVALLHRIVGGLGAVHAEHAQINSAVGIERPYPLEGGDCRHAGGGGKLAQLLLGIGHTHPATDVEHRALGGSQQGAGCGQFRGVERLRLFHRKQRALGRHGSQLYILGEIDQHRTRAPSVAIAKASANTRPRSAASVTMKECLVQERDMPSTSTS